MTQSTQWIQVRAPDVLKARHREKNGEQGKVLNHKKKQYFYHAGSGASDDKQFSSQLVISGKTLIDMADDNYESKETEKQSKQLMRYLINHYIGDKPLYSKQLFMANGD